MSKLKIGWGDKFAVLKSNKTKHIVFLVLLAAIIAFGVWMLSGCASGGGGSGPFRAVPEEQSSQSGGHLIAAEVGVDQPAECDNDIVGPPSPGIGGGFAYIEGVVRIDSLDDIRQPLVPDSGSPSLRRFSADLADSSVPGYGLGAVSDVEKGSTPMLASFSFESFFGNVWACGLFYLGGVITAPIFWKLVNRLKRRA